MNKKTLKIATRKSPLALWQAQYVKQNLVKHYPDLKVELVTMTTKGDKILDTPLAKIGGKGLFVKELERALMTGAADIAVHSMKDVPMEFPEGLTLEIICERENPHDALVSNKYQSIDELPQGAVIGTSSLRRKAQLAARRPDLIIKDLRGNVGTRLKKLDDGLYDAIILAAAGLIRLELKDRIKEYIAKDIMIPAVGQGAVGIECRSEDQETKDLISVLHHRKTATRVNAERAMNKRLSGGCQVPIAGHAVIKGESIELTGFVGSEDGTTTIRKHIKDSLDKEIEIGTSVADELIEQGAMKILQAIRSE